MNGTLAIWLPGALVAIAGMLVGLGVGLKISRGPEPEGDLDEALDELEQKKEHFISLLRDLEAQQSKIPTKAYRAQKREYEKLAAETLRQKDHLLEKSHTTQSNPRTLSSATPALSPLKAGLWGAGVVAVLGGLLALALSHESKDRFSNSRQKSEAMRPLDPQSQSEMDSIQTALRKNPADVESLVRGAALLTRAMRVSEARPFIERALQFEPEHPEGLIQLAAIELTEGKRDIAQKRLEKLLQRRPDAIEAWTLHAMIALQKGERTKALESFRQYLERAPDGPRKDRVREMMLLETRINEGSESR